MRPQDLHPTVQQDVAESREREQRRADRRQTTTALLRPRVVLGVLAAVALVVTFAIAAERALDSATARIGTAAENRVNAVLDDLAERVAERADETASATAPASPTFTDWLTEKGYGIRFSVEGAQTEKGTLWITTDIEDDADAADTADLAERLCATATTYLLDTGQPVAGVAVTTHTGTIISARDGLSTPCRDPRPAAPSED